MVYKLKYRFCEYWNMTFTPSSTRLPSLVEHDVVGRFGESRLGRVTEMLVVVEVGR